MDKSQAQNDATVSADVQAFADLRDRVGKAVREIERLRKENTALSARVSEQEASGGGGGFGLADTESPEALKARIQGFIDTINALLGESAEAAQSGS